MKNHHPSQFQMLQMTECHKEKEPTFFDNFSILQTNKSHE
jgi:hypothetical protein